MKVQYVIKSVPTDDKQALEDLLNEMSEAGWDLYTMHEIESEKSIDFNCIFMREKHEEDKTELDDIVDVTNFKYRMEKMLAAPTSPYESCKEILLKITNQKERIKKIKSQLESEELSANDKTRLNNQMSDELKSLDALKQSLMKEISPDEMYSTIKEEKFTVNLSEEILDLVSLDNADNLLAQTVKVRQELTDRLGYVIPHIHFHSSDDLEPNEFSIKIHDVEVFRTEVYPGYVAFFKNELKRYKPTSNDIVIEEDEITARELIWIPQENVKNFWAKGLSAVEYIGKAIECVAIKEVAEIMDYNDVNKYIEIVMEKNSFLVDNIIPEFLTASELKYLLTSLIREQVSVKNIVYLFEKINDCSDEPTKEDLLDKVRLSFAKMIIKDLAQDGELQLMELSDETAKMVAGFFEESAEEMILKITSGDLLTLIFNIGKLMKSKKISKPILVVPMEMRHMMFTLLSEFIPSLTVLALEELIKNGDFDFVGEV